MAEDTQDNQPVPPSPDALLKAIQDFDGPTARLPDQNKTGSDPLPENGDTSSSVDPND